MKKIIIGITALVYLVLSSGFVMDVHYCMGKVSGVGLFATGSDKCSKCGMKDKKGCCTDQVKLYKLADTHKNVTNNIEFNAGDIAVLSAWGQYKVHFTSEQISLALQNHSPPDIPNTPLHILYCDFRI